MWFDVPNVLPYTCSLCGNGAEQNNHKPFWVSPDWNFTDTDGRTYRLIICRVCMTAMVTEHGSPIRRKLAVEPTPTVVLGGSLNDAHDKLLVQAIADEVEARLVGLGRGPRAAA